MFEKKIFADAKHVKPGLDGSIRLELSAMNGETVGNASTVLLGAGAGLAPLQDFGAESSSSAAGSLAFDRSSSSPFELVPAAVSQDNDSSLGTSLPGVSEE